MPSTPGVNETWRWKPEEPGRGGALGKGGNLELVQVPLQTGWGSGIHRGCRGASRRAQGWREEPSSPVTRGPGGAGCAEPAQRPRLQQHGFIPNQTSTEMWNICPNIGTQIKICSLYKTNVAIFPLKNVRVGYFVFLKSLEPEYSWRIKTFSNLPSIELMILIHLIQSPNSVG